MKRINKTHLFNDNLSKHKIAELDISLLFKLLKLTNVKTKNKKLVNSPLILEDLFVTKPSSFCQIRN